MLLAAKNDTQHFSKLSQSSAWSVGCKGAKLYVLGITFYVSRISFIMQTYVSEVELFRCSRLQFKYGR